eukprot:CAMPEP_0113480018 /NCGR_PEP_ID=MMETSP0014_2-20120614/21631_1 /TAXON_ID=2857 /ORGANISM="Nitzschia sp." /LENGTH=1032 /DNA_ID=CAMNT_0000373379 /DNA_START=24 /DNA_END=3122 /DNA_ORIENTATION=- /assembly_acc=CAM_ASM_000159
MTRGNWQRRVELNEARRNEAKKKKQRNEEKKLWKAQASSFLTMLDKNTPAIMSRNRRQKQKQQQQQNQQQQHQSRQRESGVIHIYTDTLPSDSPPVLDLWEEDTNNKKKFGGGKQKQSSRARARSISIENEKAAIASSGGGGGGGGSNSTNKKKVHPRSKESHNNNNNNNRRTGGGGGGGGNVDDDGGDASSLVVVAPKLCRSYFFQGTCQGGGSSGGGGKKGGGKRSQECRFVHYPKRYTSLYKVLSSTPEGKDSLSTSEIAYVENTSGSPSNDTTNDDDLMSRTETSMDMIYYFSMNLDEFDGFVDNDHDDDGAPSTKLLSVWLTDQLQKRNCNLGSLVYIALDDTLLYDRYRRGTVVDDDSFSSARASSLTGGLDGGNDTDPLASQNGQDIAKAMPASVLEYCLLFLEDPAVAVMSSVCRAWNQEIGKQSGDLWRNLLRRRNWPLPLSLNQQRTGDDDSLNGVEEAQQLRVEFVSHYKAVRVCRAMKSGIGVLTSGKKNAAVNHSEYCTRSFETIENAPQEGNYCVSLKIFSPNRVLVAYRNDCTLRLFDSTERVAGSGGGMLCRELLCYCIDPYRNTRKRDCKVVAMSLDESCVGSLLQVTDDGTGAEASILAVVGRDALLVADDSVDNASTQIIDINQSVLNYLLSCEEADHGLLQLLDFLSDGGDLDDVEVRASRCIESSGYGRFLVEVSVSIPIGDAADDDDSDTAMEMLFRKLFLISSTMGAIIWMCDSSVSPGQMRHRHDDMTLTATPLEENGRWRSRIISVSAHCSGIMCGSVHPSGEFSVPLLIDSSNSLRSIDEQNGWSLRQVRLRAVANIGHIIVMADNLLRTEDEVTTYKSVLRFYSSDISGEVANSTSMAMDENILICSLTRLDEKHAMAVGIKTVARSVEGDVLDGVDGQWFGEQEDARPENEKKTIISVVVDVQSRSEIFRTEFADYNQISVQGVGSDFLNEGDVPLLVAADGDTFAAGVWWKGLLLGGEDAREASQSTKSSPTETPNTKSKKKKKGPKKGGKKDGFARGMSLRG